jgi:hypothetical protein
MAHECPDCGQTCYCGGDIDDCCLNSEHYYMNCSHCDDTGNDYEDDEYCDTGNDYKDERRG